MDKKMGVQQSCQLDRMSDLCDMHTCISKIKGRASDAGSQTETWIATLKPGTTYEGIECTHAFMKIGINPASIPVLEQKKAAIGLMYELQVYNQLVTPILDAYICPHFLRSYLVSYNCRHADLVHALAAGLDVSRSRAKQHLDRGLSYLQDGLQGRPAVHEPLDGSRYARPSSNLRFMVLTTEYTDVQTYADWLKLPHSTQTTLAVLLQIVVGLHTMALSKLMHNDLRGGNIFVQTLAEPQTFFYTIQGLGQPVRVTTRYKAMIYDFNKATSQSLGENAMFTRSRRFRELPPFEEKRDLVCLYKNLESLNERSGIAQFFDMTGVRQTAWYLGRGDETPTSLLTGLKSIAAALQPIQPIQPIENHVEVQYTITRDMFMRDGSLNRDHKALTDLRWHNEQFETKIIEFNAYIEKCQAAVAQRKAQLAEARKTHSDAERLKKENPPLHD